MSVLCRGQGAAALFIGLLVYAPAASAEDTRPNIVVFLVDDLGAQDTAVPFAGKPFETNLRYRTPSIAQLASEGEKFVQAYSCPVCTPSRVSFLTGQNAARHNVTNWTLRKDTSTDARYDALTLPAWNVNGLSPVADVPRTVAAKPLPAYLREAGYFTIHCGKAHWGAAGTPGADPLNLGFDINIAGHAAGAPGSYRGIDNFAREGEDPIWDVPGLEQYHGRDISLTEALTIEANRAVDVALEQRKPFFLHLAHYAVHTPWQEDPRFIANYAHLPKQEAIYASMVEAMDDSLGKLRAHLDERGVAANTLFIFTSDNGSYRDAPPNLPLRGHKATPYEGGIRVPLIAAWPGRISPGAVCSVPTLIEDLFPTVLQAAGLALPVDKPVDGMSLLPYFENPARPAPERPLVWHFPNSHEHQREPFSTIREGRWKLIYWYASRSAVLYDLSADPSESADLSAIIPAETARLTGRLLEILRQRGARVPQ